MDSEEVATIVQQLINDGAISVEPGVVYVTTEPQVIYVTPEPFTPEPLASTPIPKPTASAKTQYLGDDLLAYEYNDQYRYAEYPSDKKNALIMAGKEYKHGVAFSSFMPASVDPPVWALYNLSREYQTLSFDIGHVDGTKLAPMEVAFYLDGECYETYTIQPDEMPRHIEIPVLGVTQLKIEEHHQGGHLGTYATVGLGDPVLTPVSAEQSTLSSTRIGYQNKDLC